MVKSIFEVKFMSVIDFQLYLPYLHIKQKKAPIILQIMELWKTDTATFFNRGENNSKEYSKRATTNEINATSQYRVVVVNRLVAATLKYIENMVWKKLSEDLVATLHDDPFNSRSFSRKM